MKQIKLVTSLFLAAVMLTACSGNSQETTAAIDERINTRNGELSFETTNGTKSELLTNDSVEYQDSYHLELDEDEDLYVGTYLYDGVEYTAGYAVNCDFKEYLNFTNIESAEADTINDRDYTIAYYDQNMKSAYYSEDDVCVYVYSDAEMTNDEFKEDIKEMDIRLELDDQED